MTRRPIVNEREVAAAAGELLDRLDDLYDQRPDSLARLVAVIESHSPVVQHSEVGQLASVSRLQLLDVCRSQHKPAELIRLALVATGDLRLVCADVWATGTRGE